MRNDNKFNWVRKLNVRQKARVYFKTLTHINCLGSAKFVSINTIPNTSELIVTQGGLEDAVLKVKGDYIYLNCSNTGGVIISGTCFLLSASVDDISFVNSLYLNADKCYLTSFSRDNSFVYGKQEVDLKLHGAGDIFYKADSGALVQTELTGSGHFHAY